MATLWLDLPEVLDAPGLERLERTLARAGKRGVGARDVHAWALRGTGGVFCRGMALGAMAKSGPQARAALERFARVLGMLRAAPRPTVAVVDGEALGGGVGLAAACDRVLATSRASFGLPEALFGVLPGVVLPALHDRMPPQKVRLLVLDGASRDARWALAAGLVDDLVSEATLETHVARCVRSFGRVATERVLGLRSWSDEARQLRTSDGLVRGAEVTSALLEDPRVLEGLRRFSEEGIPPWEEVSA